MADVDLTFLMERIDTLIRKVDMNSTEMREGFDRISEDNLRHAYRVTENVPISVRG